MRVWRLSLARFAGQAFAGRGSLHAAGRWHPIGVAVVYTAGSLALAALEFFVNWNSRTAAEPLVAIPAEIPAELIFELEKRRLPSNWRAEPAVGPTRHIGAGWVKAQTSAVLAVLSAIVPQERNYLLNPAHSDFEKIRIGKPELFSFDPRMWK